MNLIKLTCLGGLLSLISRNTKDLLDPEKFRLKVLCIAIPGTGKSTWAGTAPNPGFAACETGHGNGLASIATLGIDYCTPESYKEFESFCSGDVFKEKDTLVVDSLSAMAKTFIKDYALTFPRGRGDTLKRKAGIPELDDYGVMGECTRRLLAKLLNLDKHVIVTCTLKMPQEANPEEGRVAMPGLPDLPGQMALAASAMFDATLIMRTRPALRDPKDAKSRYSQRYLMTQPTDQWAAKNRLGERYGQSFWADEEVFDLKAGLGTFPDLLNKVIKGYTPVVSSV